MKNRKSFPPTSEAQDSRKDPDLGPLPRESVQERWLGALATARCILQEFPAAQIQSIELTPHGFAVSFDDQGSFSPDWLCLIERHADRIPEPKRLHEMLASNAAEWLRARKQKGLADQLMTLGKAEVKLIEWEDQQVLWLPAGESIEIDRPFFWTLCAADAQPLEGRKGWQRIWIEGVAASARDTLRRVQKNFKTLQGLELEAGASEGAILGGAALEVRRLWAQWPVERVPLALVEGGLSRSEALLELADGWCRQRGGGDREPVLGAIGSWSAEETLIWGDLVWQVSDRAADLPLKDWLQSVSERLKLLGFVWEIVAHVKAPRSSKAGDVAQREAAQWLARWAKSQGLRLAADQGFDWTHQSEEWEGPSLEWRVFDPLGASWPVARLAVAVDAQAAWSKQWARHFNRQAEQDAPRVERRAALLKDGRWLMASTCMDVEQESRLSDIWKRWTSKAKPKKSE